MMGATPRQAVFILVGDPQRRSAGKDMVTLGYIRDLIQALNLNAVDLYILGSEKSSKEPINPEFNVGGTTYFLRSPNLIESVARFIGELLRGNAVILAEALFLSRKVEDEIVSRNQGEATWVVFDTIRSFSLQLFRLGPSILLVDDLFSERLAQTGRLNGAMINQAPGRYRSNIGRLMPIWLVQPFFRILLNLESRLSARKEIASMLRANHSFILNPIERSRVLERSGQVNLHTYVPGILPEIQPPNSSPFIMGEKRHWLVVGAYDYGPNVDGLQWLMRVVYPVYRALGGTLGLAVVGRGLTNDLQTELSMTGGKYLGYVDNLAQQYSLAQAALVPVRYGSGIKVKLLEAVAYGCKVISTSVGAEGLSEKPPALSVADTPEQFARALLDAENTNLSEVRRNNLDWYRFHFGDQRLRRLQGLLRL